MGTHLNHMAYELVAGYHGVDRYAPFVAGLVQVRVANAAVGNVKADIVRANVSALKRPGL
jgi:hypothetical protein